jgi:hypothetical protein
VIIRANDVPQPGAPALRPARGRPGLPSQNGAAWLCTLSSIWVDDRVKISDGLVAGELKTFAPSRPSRAESAQPGGAGPAAAASAAPTGEMRRTDFSSTWLCWLCLVINGHGLESAFNQDIGSRLRNGWIGDRKACLFSDVLDCRFRMNFVLRGGADSQVIE